MDEKFQISLLVKILQLEELTKLKEKINEIRQDAENPIGIRINVENDTIERAKKEIDSIFDSLKQDTPNGLSTEFKNANSELKEIMPFIDEVISKVRTSEDAMNAITNHFDEDITKAMLAGGILQGINEQEKEIENSKKRQNELTKSALTVSKKIFTSLIGVTSIYGLLRQSMSAYLSQNEELKSRINEIKYALGSAIAPIVEWLVNMAQVLVSVLDYILKCLGLAGLKFGGMAKNSGGAAKSSKKTAENLKEANKQLAGFDEINNLSKAEENTNDLGSRGAGAGAIGSTWNNDFASKIQSNIAEISAILSTAFLVLGAILTFSGANIPLGLGLMALGAIGLVAVIKENWGSMSPKLSSTLSTLLGIISGAFLALGAIFLFTGVATGLGIALMAVGAASLVAAIAVNWHASDNHIKDSLKTILGIVAGVSLALGALLCLTGVNIPLGIALLAVGAVSIISAVSLNWNSAESSIGKTLQAIALVVGASLLVIGVLLAFTGVALPLGIALIIAGLGSLYAGSTVKWDEVGKKLGKTWDGIKKTASKAWNGIKETVGNAVKNSSEFIKDKYDKVSTWVSDNWSTLKDKAKEKWNEIKTSISNSLNKTKENASTAWNNIKSSASTSWNNIKTAYSDAETWFNTNVSSKIKSKFKDAFDDVKEKAEKGWENITKAFNGVQTWFNDNVTSKILGLFNTLFGTGKSSVGSAAKTGVTNIESPFNDAKSGVSTSFGNITKKILNKFTSLFTGDGEGTVKNVAKKGWDNIHGEFKDKKLSIPSEILEPTVPDVNYKINIPTEFILPSYEDVWNEIRNYTGEFGVSVNIPSYGNYSGGKVTGDTPSPRTGHTTPHVPVTADSNLLGWDKTHPIKAAALGTDYVFNDGLAYIHKGEAIVPAEFNQGYSGGIGSNEETNELLERLIDVVQSKEFKTYISQSDIGRASVNYINQQSRIMGGSIL